MFKALFYSDSSSEWFLEWIQTEAKRRISVDDIIEELSALLYFKIVGSIQSSLVNCASHIVLFSLTFTTWHKHIQSENIMYSKLLRIHFLLECLSVVDYLVSINQMFLQLVRKDTL